MRRLGLATLLLGLSLGVVPWPPVSLAQPAADEALVVEGRDGVIVSDGLIFRPRVDTKNWTNGKSMTVNFTLRREDGRRFVDSVESVRARLNNKDVQLAPGSLTPARKTIKVLFMIDRSGSMISAGTGVKKLEAAKDSLRYFVRLLNLGDEAAIFAFDQGQKEYVALTSNQEHLQDGINQITVSDNGSGRYTSLYCSIQYALDKAKDIDVQDVIFLTDGKEDSRPNYAAEGCHSAPSKGEEEERLSQIARESGIHVHTIAIGAQGVAGEGGVDRETLEHISSKSNEGLARFIEVATLKPRIGGDPVQSDDRLTEELNDVLAEIKKRIEHDYEQPVPLSNLPEGASAFRLTVTVEKDGKHIPFAVDYDISWDKNRGAPEFLLRRVGRHMFINPKPAVGWLGLWLIYFLLLMPLALLLLLPSAYARVTTARAMVQMRHAIEVVERGSPLRGKQCPNEMGAAGQRYAFKEGDAALVCPKCNTPHHLSCWEYNQHRCMNRVCEYQFPVPERLLDKYRPSDARERFI